MSDFSAELMSWWRHQVGKSYCPRLEIPLCLGSSWICALVLSLCAGVDEMSASPLCFVCPQLPVSTARPLRAQLKPLACATPALVAPVGIPAIVLVGFLIIARN